MENQCNCQCQMATKNGIQQSCDVAPALRVILEQVHKLSRQTEEITKTCKGIIEQLEAVSLTVPHGEQSCQCLYQEKLKKQKTFSEVFNMVETPTDDSPSNEDTSTLLHNQLKSKYYDDWLKVAQCSLAEPKHLLLAVRQIVGEGDRPSNGTRRAIAQAAAMNKAANSEVIRALMASSYYDVWEQAARCPQATEDDLCYIVQKLIHNHNASNNSDECNDCSQAVANAVLAHPRCSVKVLSELILFNNRTIRQKTHAAMHKLTGITE